MLGLLSAKVKPLKVEILYLTVYNNNSLLHGAESFLRSCSSASQEIPRILWNPKVHYRTHKYLTPVPTMSQVDPFHTITSHFLKIHLNIILPCTPGSPKWSLYTPLLSPIRATCSAHLILDFITRTILGEQYRSLSFSLLKCIIIIIIIIIIIAMINSIHEEIKSRLHLGNACYYSVHNLLSSRLLSKNLKIKI